MLVAWRSEEFDSGLPVALRDVFAEAAALRAGHSGLELTSAR
jgi:hypothetical protein